LAALGSLSQSGEPLPIDQVFAAATDKDSYLRQTSTKLLARRAELSTLNELAGHSDPRRRLAGVLATGQRLTIPPQGDIPPESLPLSYPKESAFFHRQQFFWGAKDAVDLQGFGRLGSYTMAERWHALPHSEEQESLLKLLLDTLSDTSPAVR